MRIPVPGPVSCERDVLRGNDALPGCTLVILIGHTEIPPRGLQIGINMYPLHRLVPRPRCPLQSRRHRIFYRIGGLV
jgi:hypothetical protein